MSWEDHRRRRDAISAVLAHAERYPDDPIPLDTLPEVSAAFAGRGELLLALQYAWHQVLWAQIELLSLDGQGRPLDAAGVCRSAWRRAAVLRPTLRRVLDRHLDECNSARTKARQDNLLVSAGIGHYSHPRRYVSPMQVA